ncbi:MAG: GntR family transcriptional regulator [Dongiaceae bacterium]
MLRGPTQRQVAERVVDHIVEQRLADGARINEQALARELGVSRTPVRAVLAYLAGQGVLNRRPQEGYFLVRRLSSVREAGIDSAADGPDLYGRIMIDLLIGSIEGTTSLSALLRRYDVSRGDMMATLRRMTREGLVEPAAGHGWTFLQFQASTIEKGYRLRLLIEPAVLLEPDYRCDERALHELQRDHLEAIRGLSRKTPWGELFGIDARFHETVARGSGNDLVVETIQKQNRIRRLCEYLGYERLDRVKASLKEHLSILESLLDGDRAWAAAQLRRHLDKSLKQSLTHYPRDIAALRSGARRLDGMAIDATGRKAGAR